MNDPIAWGFGLACLILVLVAEPFLNRLSGRDHLGLRLLVWGLTLEGIGGLIAICSGWHPPAILLVPIFVSIIAVAGLRGRRAVDMAMEEWPI